MGKSIKRIVLKSTFGHKLPLFMVLTAVFRSKLSHFSMGSFSIEYSGFIQYFILYQFEMRWVLSILYYFIVYCLWSLKSIKLLKKFKNWKYPSDPSCFPHTSNKCYFLGGFTKKVNRKVANEFMLEFSDLAWILFRSLNIPIFIGLIWVLEWCM